MNKDINLTNLNQYYGTESYHNVMGFNVTDGIAYVMQNGYSWIITDFLSLIVTNHKHLKEQEFLSIKLLLNDSKGIMKVTNGNNKVLYTQEYKYTDAKVQLDLYFTNGVLMLSKEY